MPREGWACKPPHPAPWCAGTWVSISHVVAQLMHLSRHPPGFLGEWGLGVMGSNAGFTVGRWASLPGVTALGNLPTLLEASSPHL